MIDTRAVGTLGLGLFLVLAATATADEGSGGFLRFAGREHFALGELTNVEIQPWSESIVLGDAGEGNYLPIGAFVSAFHSTGRDFDVLQGAFGGHIPVEGEVEVFVRAKDLASGATSRWYRVEVEGEVEFERSFDALQYMARLTTFDPGSSPSFDFFAAELGLKAEAGDDQPIDQPEVALPKPPVVSRAEWGAKPPKSGYSAHTPRQLVVHHTFSPTQAQWQGEASLRGIQAFHQNDRGWIDIGYHFMIGVDGRVFEGRPTEVSGAHVVPNPNKVGICVAGDYSEGKDTLTEASKTSLVALLAHLAGKYRIAPEGKGLTGHRDWMSTGCPGDTLYAQLPALRQAVRQALDAGRSGGSGLPVDSLLAPLAPLIP